MGERDWIGHVHLGTARGPASTRGFRHRRGVPSGGERSKSRAQVPGRAHARTPGQSRAAGRQRGDTQVRGCQQVGARLRETARAGLAPDRAGTTARGWKKLLSGNPPQVAGILTWSADYWNTFSRFS
jgi:hypothetical protein